MYANKQKLFPKNLTPLRNSNPGRLFLWADAMTTAPHHLRVPLIQNNPLYKVSIEG
jgi:hypothetical protein